MGLSCYNGVENRVIKNTLENETIGITLIRDIFSIEMIYNPSILDNVTNFHVFNDD